MSCPDILAFPRGTSSWISPSSRVRMQVTWALLQFDRNFIIPLARFIYLRLTKTIQSRFYNTLRIVFKVQKLVSLPFIYQVLVCILGPSRDDFFLSLSVLLSYPSLVRFAHAKWRLKLPLQNALDATTSQNQMNSPNPGSGSMTGMSFSRRKILNSKFTDPC